MPCLLLILTLSFPRLVLVLMWFFSHYLQRAYHGFLIPLLGFFFLPVTTIVYAWEVNNHMNMEGLNLAWLVLAVLFDLGLLGHGARQQSRR